MTEGLPVCASDLHVHLSQFPSPSQKLLLQFHVLPYRAFGENLIVEGYDFRNLPVGTRFQCGDVILEMTQIGKECHSHCEIYKRMGECIMPREGVFAVVIQGGKIKKGDILEKIEDTEAHID